MAAYGLYTHIASNKFRSMLLLAGLFLLIYVLVYAGALLAEVVIDSDRPVAYYLRAASRDLVTAFPYATIAAALWVVIAYFFHQNMIDAVTGGEDVTRQQQPRLYNLLENLCISRGIPMPKLKVMDSPALNAFAAGLNRRQYSITVTTGLLQALNDQEIEAVLGHELTHIRNGDVQLMVVAVSFPAQRPRSWSSASTTRARDLPTCSRPIRRSTHASRRWCSLLAVMIPARWPCPIRRMNPTSRRNRPPGNSNRQFPAARGTMPASPPAFRARAPAPQRARGGHTAEQPPCRRPRINEFRMNNGDGRIRN